MRCEWANESALEIDYHDKEWGVPVHDDRKLFEFITLEGAQAGLSWATILKKREGYLKAYDGFDVRKISNYDERDIEGLLRDSGIVRNRLKIKSSIQNAKHFMDIQKEFGSFDSYIWKFVDGKPKQEGRVKIDDVPSRTVISDEISKDLQNRGFKFVGSTICYAFMQAVGMVNDHTTDCFRFKELA